MDLSHDLRESFRKHFDAEARVYRAPGRVNLIGEHTDYNNGLVMPMAIDLATWIAIAPRADKKVVLRSENLSETVEFNLDEAAPSPRRHWSDYPRGVAVMLKEAGYQLGGANMLIKGEMPIGSGLSSSAAIEVATGFALLDSAGFDVDRKQLALLCQRAENEFVGMRCGLMDQFVSCFAEEGRALMLDCRSLEYQTPPLPASTRIVVCNTMVKHELAASEYNVRRAECEEGARLLAEELPRIRSLRDVEMADLKRFESKLTGKVMKRCRHVVSENDRVVTAATALEGNDLELLGRLMNQSHQSLRDDFEVSCHELDVMVDLAQQQPGVFGARVTGGGFGGCTVNLVRGECVDEFTQRIGAEYEKGIGLVPEIFICSASQGAGRIL